MIIEQEASLILTATSVEVRWTTGALLRFERSRLPDSFLRWQSEARLRLLRLMSEQGAEAVRVNPAHLPVVATIGIGAFPANLACRGIGVLPCRDRLEEFTQLLEQARLAGEGEPPPVTLARRAEAAAKVYADPGCFDQTVLGGLEIFEGQTAANLLRNPLASLLYVGEAPHFLSYQLNCVVQTVGDQDPSYRFLRAARELFARDHFHVTQKRYPGGYLFHVVEVRDKTPYPRP